MARGRISSFPIDLRRRPYSTVALPCSKMAKTKLCINYEREMYVLAHLNLSTASTKCLKVVHMCFTLLIYKQFNFCRFRESAYTNVDRLCAVSGLDVKHRA